ncbi:glutamine synthetase [Tistlia consotensis]|uniref:Glutamine synthetase n=1 Tax=Tistlia consotensis USBA 355 TaxID=560819 RepID=A0A1Y6BPV2_9PROT|nr:glutamine synthetase family protein [Tistlia consotensis]SMF19217.1 glutamine synthetase [Tistlia consotensis USBA 355]SNR39107.1 glutamine synthetase [Tistlia consotensis]
MAKGKDRVAEEVARLRHDGIEFLRFELPDLHGSSRSKLVPIDAVEGYARKGLNFYGGVLGLDSAANVISGTGLNEEISYADSKLFPDFSTLRRVPWKPNTAKVICDVHYIDGSPIKASPRWILAQLVAQAGDLGYDVMMSHEFEFYLLDRDTREPLFEGVHIFNSTRNSWIPALDTLLAHLQGVGVDLITHNCEYAGSQFEINYGPALGVAAADKAFTFKNTVKEVAHHEGYLATFMSKPWSGRAGCGCHFHISLIDRKTGRNAFLDRNDKDGLSPVARQFAAGILKHAPALTALIAPTPNCYHRLKPHTFAPSNVSWGIEDRSALVRSKATGDEGTHHEMRGASGLANPYLSAAGTLAAGLLGLQGKLKLGPQSKGPSEDDPRHPKLPSRLDLSLAALEADKAFGAMLGADFLKLFTAVKGAELQRFWDHVTDWERAEYMELY